ncbi:MAG: CYTH domain-containing protein [Victivallales bacterium]|nr:CYTH domain-containing protein [Victivallales bacterium]
MFEIERKFEVNVDHSEWRGQAVRSFSIVQGYFEETGSASVRVRISGNDKANLNIKSHDAGIRRLEYEYPIPVEEAREMLRLFCAGRIIEKTRHIVPAAEEGLFWEIDEYHGPFAGHFTAELEIPQVDFDFVRPAWLGVERTGDPRFTNASLARRQCWPIL